MKSLQKKAFTLLEVMISITILTLTVVGVYYVSSSTKALIASSENKATAMYLAQEGLEYARNLRDKKIGESWNRTNGWDKFLTEDIGFEDLDREGVVTKKIGENEIGLYELEVVDTDKDYKNLDQICEDFLNWSDCEIEVIKSKISETDGETGEAIYFRKLTFEKEEGETNLITVTSSVYRDYKGKLQNFSLKTKLGNLTIY